MSFDRALQKIQSGLRGQWEPLRAFGVPDSAAGLPAAPRSIFRARRHRAVELGPPPHRPQQPPDGFRVWTRREGPHGAQFTPHDLFPPAPFRPSRADRRAKAA